MNVALSQLLTQNNCAGAAVNIGLGISRLILCNITPRLTVRMNPEYQINLIKPHSIRSHYRPQRSWGKVMFLQASVILLMGGVSASVHAGIHPPRVDTPLEQTPPGSRHPPGADTPPGSRHPLGADPPQQTPPGSQTPPGADTPWEQTHTPREQTPPTADTPQSRHLPPGAEHAGRYGQRAGGTHPTGMQSCF